MKNRAVKAAPLPAAPHGSIETYVAVVECLSDLRKPVPGSPGWYYVPFSELLLSMRADDWDMLPGRLRKILHELGIKNTGLYIEIESSDLRQLTEDFEAISAQKVKVAES